MASCAQTKKRYVKEVRAMQREFKRIDHARHRLDSLKKFDGSRPGDMKRRIAKAVTAIGQAIQAGKAQSVRMVEAEKALSRCRRR